MGYIKSTSHKYIMYFHPIHPLLPLPSPPIIAIRSPRQLCFYSSGPSLRYDFVNLYKI